MLMDDRKCIGERRKKATRYTEATTRNFTSNSSSLTYVVMTMCAAHTLSCFELQYYMTVYCIGCVFFLNSNTICILHIICSANICRLSHSFLPHKLCICNIFYLLFVTGFGVITSDHVERGFRRVDRKFFVPAVRVMHSYPQHL